MGWRDAPLAESSGEPAWKRAPLVAEPPMEAPAAIGPEGLLNYVKDYGSKVFNAFTDNTTHEDLPDIPGAGVADAAATMLSGIPAAVAAPALAGQRTMDGGADSSLGQSFQDLTWAPKTRGGAQLLEGAGALLQPVGDVLHGLGQGAGRIAGAFGGSPETQADVGTLVDTILPNLAGLKGLGAAREALPHAPPPTVGSGAAGETAARLRQSGYTVAPSTAARLAQREAPPGVMPSVPGHFTESLVNRGELAGRMGTESAKNTEGIIRAEFGLPEGTPVTPEMLQALSRSQNAAYDLVPQALPVLQHTAEVQGALDSLGAARRNNPYLQNNPQVEQLRAQLEGIPNAPTQQALDAIRQWREDARTNFQAVDDVGKQDLARQYRNAANALEEGIQTQLDATGNKHIADQWRAARVVQAKIHNVLDAWSGNELDPQALARLGQDTRLTGGLSDIAYAATHAPETVFSTTGTSITRPSNASWINTPESGLRRFLFEKWVIPRLMSEGFQNKYGLAGPHTPNTIAPPELPRPPPPAGLPNLDDLLGGGGEPVPWNPEVPPADLSGAGSPAPLSLVPDLESLLSGGALGELLGGLPEGKPGPMKPPRGAGLRDLGNELGKPDGTAGPEEFPVTPKRPAPAAPGGAEFAPEPPVAANLGREFGGAANSGSLKDVLANYRASQGIDETQFQRDMAARRGDQTNPLNAAISDMERIAGEAGNVKIPPSELALGESFDRPAAGDLSGEVMKNISESGPQMARKVPGMDLEVSDRGRGKVVLQGKGRKVTLERSRDGKKYTIRGTNVDDAMRAQGLGQGNIVEAVKFADSEGAVLDSDTSYTKDAWRAVNRALEKGIIEADNVPYDEIKAAFERDPGVATNPKKGESWIKNIRLGPNAK